MTENWFSRLFMPKVTESPPSLNPALDIYRRALDNLTDDSKTLLAALLARDGVTAVQEKADTPTPEQAALLGELDGRLRKTTAPLDKLSQWRDSLHPDKANWWWRLDEAQEKREQEKDLLWELLAAALFLIFTVPFAVDIIQRLWVNVPDNFTVVGSSLTLLVTASPFTKRGRELIQWVLKRISWLSARHHAEARVATALVALIVVVAIRFVLLPQYAHVYNNRGVAALEAGDLTAARQQLQRAAALNKEFSVGYYNLAAVYEEVAQPEKAIALYEEAIAQDLTFAPAYNNLGRLYLQQGEPERAIMLLQAGLDRLGDGESVEETTTRYQSLTHLGQAYYELGDAATAVTILQQATALETKLDPAFHNARPHYYLALAYKTLERPSADIAAEWEAALSYLDEDDPVGWDTTVREGLEESRQ